MNSEELAKLANWHVAHAETIHTMNYRDRDWHLDAAAALRQAALQDVTPIDMVLHCPKCHTQHIDAPEKHDRMLCDTDPPAAWAMPPWKNEPHRSHLCHGCGHIWRPADVPTNGVAAIKTKGQERRPDRHYERESMSTNKAGSGAQEAIRLAEDLESVIRFDGDRLAMAAQLKIDNAVRFLRAARPAPPSTVEAVPVATVRRDGLPAFGFATVLMRWEPGAESLPLGIHTLYAAPSREAVPALTVPADVHEAAVSFVKDGYRGPLAWAKRVFDWVATQPATGREGQEL